MNGSHRLKVSTLFGILLVASATARAQEDTLFVANSKVGVGTETPTATVHVKKADGTAQVLIEETAASPGVTEMLVIDASAGTNGRPRLTFLNPSGKWYYEINGTNFDINRAGTGPPDELRLQADGDLVIGGSLTELSSRASKTGFAELDPRVVLRQVVELPVLSWHFRASDTGAKHVGPIAEDFHRAFGLGEDDEHIAPSDKSGVALLAIQGLQLELGDRDRRIAELEAVNAQLQADLVELRQLVQGLAAPLAREPWPH
jgi:hypothetical protein